MADASVTLTQSQSSSSSGLTYRGYVINLCDNSKVDDGTWSPSSYDGIGVSIDENKITIWNTNTTGSSVSNTFTWTSSKVSSCTKTLSVTAEGVVITLKSGNTEIVVTAYYSTSTGGYSIYSYQDEFLINESSSGIVTTSNTVSAAPVITCKGGMSEYWINYAQNNTDNKIHVSVNPNMSTYFVGCTGDYTATGTNTINLKYYDREMTISFPVKFKFILSANYKFYHKEFFSSEEISGWSETFTIFNYHTYSLNEIIEGQNFACAESPNDNSVSASLLTVSNFSSNNSNFTSSSLAIDDDDDPSGFFYIGVKCNTNNIVNLFNGNNAFSATMTFDLSYSNASIPVTINISKDKVETTQYYNISIKYTMSDTKSVAIRGTLASTTFSLDQKNKSASTQKQAGSYKLNIQTLDITVNATFAGKYLGLFKTEDNITTLLTDIADVSSVKSVSKSNINYNFAVTDYSISFEIIPYNPATGYARCYLYVGNYNRGHNSFTINVKIGKYKLLDTHVISSSMPTERLTFNFFDKFKVYDSMGMGYVSFSITGGEQNSDNKISIDIDENLTTNHYVEYINLSSYSDYTYSATTDVSIRSDAVLTITIADYN